jgi:hypothetical protein
MDPNHIMGGAPAIKLLLETGDAEGIVHLHPYYGNFEIESSIPLQDGEVYDLQCPECHVSVRAEEDRCMFCGAPMMALHLPKGGQVQTCCRRGCHNHKLKIVDVSAQLAGIFELDTRPRF